MTAAGVTPSSPTSTYAYGYTDANWGDKLTSYRGQTITYDEIGNPLSYYNGSSYTFTWENGRRLASATTGNSTLIFDYNDEGIRTSKIVNGVEHVYYLNGSQILAESWDNRLMIFIYDASGSPIGFQYRNEETYEPGVFVTYWYIKNLQGDIVAVSRDDGVVHVSYSYDAWGNVTTTYLNGGYDAAAYFNPFKYRGYYHDSETGFYYLNSRYYDPATGRFLNADGYVSTGQGILGYNMYAYCNNNPVNMIDSNGNFPWKIVVVIVALVVLGGVFGFFYDGQLGESVSKTSPETDTDVNNNSDETEEFTICDRIQNALVGMTLGATVTGAGYIFVGAIWSLAVGSVTIPLILGATGAEIVSLGVIAYDLGAYILPLFFDVEMEVIDEFPSTNVPKPDMKNNIIN